MSDTKSKLRAQFIQACLSKDWDSVERLSKMEGIGLALGAKSMKHFDPKSILNWAVKNNEVALMESLLEVHEPAAIHYLSFQAACAAGHFQVVQRIAGFTHWTKEDYSDAFFMACSFNHMDIANHLFNRHELDPSVHENEAFKFLINYNQTDLLAWCMFKSEDVRAHVEKHHPDIYAEVSEKVAVFEAKAGALALSKAGLRRRDVITHAIAPKIGGEAARQAVAYMFQAQQAPYQSANLGAGKEEEVDEEPQASAGNMQKP